VRIIVPDGLPGKGGPSLHYFRHTVRPLMRRAGFNSATMDKITGHESGGSIGDVVYDHWLLEELRPAVEAIQFPGLKLTPSTALGLLRARPRSTVPLCRHCRVCNRSCH
jgi:hypothetical protein